MATVPIACQLVPPFSEYCQEPCVPESAVLPTTTTPAKRLALEPPGTASLASVKVELKRSATVSPGLSTAGLLGEVTWFS